MRRDFQVKKAAREGQRIMVFNIEATGLKLKSCLFADVQRGKRMPITGTQNIRSVTQGKLRTVKQEVKQLNVVTLQMSGLK